MAAYDCNILIESDGRTYDLKDSFSLYLSESPIIQGLPIKDVYTESYAETNGVVIYPYTSYNSFDYKLKLIFYGNKGNEHGSINNFKNLMISGSGSGVSLKEVKIKNEYKNTEIYGYYKSLEAGDLYKVLGDKIILNFTLTLLVTNPEKCLFL